MGKRQPLLGRAPAAQYPAIVTLQYAQTTSAPPPSPAAKARTRKRALGVLLVLTLLVELAVAVWLVRRDEAAREESYNKSPMLRHSSKPENQIRHRFIVARVPVG